MQGGSNTLGDFSDCAPGVMALTNQEITPSALANGNNNNYAIGFKQNGLLRLAGDAGGGSSLTGFGFHQDGQNITVVNISANPIFVDNESASSTAANRIITPGGLQIRLQQNDSIEAVYDGVSDRWRVVKMTITGVQTYSASNVVTDRSYDANATTVDELADVLGTLIADLRARGVVL